MKFNKIAYFCVVKTPTDLSRRSIFFRMARARKKVIAVSRQCGEKFVR